MLRPFCSEEGSIDTSCIDEYAFSMDNGEDDGPLDEGLSGAAGGLLGDEQESSDDVFALPAEDERKAASGPKRGQATFNRTPRRVSVYAHLSCAHFLHQL